MKRRFDEVVHLWRFDARDEQPEVLVEGRLVVSMDDGTPPTAKFVASSPSWAGDVLEHSSLTELHHAVREEVRRRRISAAGGWVPALRVVARGTDASDDGPEHYRLVRQLTLAVAPVWFGRDGAAAMCLDRKLGSARPDPYAMRVRLDRDGLDRQFVLPDDELCREAVASLRKAWPSVDWKYLAALRVRSLWDQDDEAKPCT